MKFRIALAAALLAAPAVENTPYAAPAQAQLGELTHCVVIMNEGSRIAVSYGSTSEACIALGRRCAGSQPYNAINFYSSPVYSGAPYRVCSLY
jgi:hypothetical protein